MTIETAGAGRKTENKEAGRQAELERLAGEDYKKQWGELADILDKRTDSFRTANYHRGQIAGLIAHAYEKIASALKEGDLTVAQETLETLEKQKEEHRIGAGTSAGTVHAVRTMVSQFLDHFGLKGHITLKEGMTSEEIKRAIILGYEAKMWELTNKTEDHK